MDIFNVSVEDWVLNEDGYLKRLSDQEIWDRIPLVNGNELHNFKDGTLVRFRGMIQDMYGPEYFLRKFEITNELTNEAITRNGKYCDGTVLNKWEKIDFENSTNLLSERQSYVVISIPGINSWVQQYECIKYKVPTKLEEPQATSSQNKRSYDAVMDTESDSESINTAGASKKVTNELLIKAEPQNIPLVSAEHILNHPLSDEKSRVCHIKVYKDFETLKLNDVCEFVGFLCVNPVMDNLFHDDEGIDMGNQLENQTHHPPGSLVPRIHAVHFKTLQHNNPLIDSFPNESTSNFDAVKKEILIVLTQMLLGDALAAEYLLCNLISEIYLRDFMPLGKFSLNISNVPKLENIDYVAEVYKFLELFVTKSHYLPITLENMNSLEFAPKKDYDCNRLTSGILQLSRNTLLVLDETKLAEGKLDSAGVQGIKLLNYAIKNQKVTYDFKYHLTDYSCDIRFLTFSEGKSMLPSDIHISLKPEKVCVNTFKEILDAAKHFLKADLLDEIRKYLTRAQLIKYEISDQAQDLVQQEFVNMRQNSNVTAEDLHTLLILGRLLCLSEGKNNLDAKCWKRACEMEKQRKDRLNQG